MSQVNNVKEITEVSNSNNISFDESAKYGAVLAGTVVSNLDDQINAQTNDLLKISAQKARAMSDKNALGAIDLTRKCEVSAATSAGLSSADAATAVFVASKDLSQIKDKALAYGVDLTGRMANGNIVSQSLVDDLKNSIDTKIQTLNSNSEIKMIQFQGLMDARKQALMELSNMMSSNNQTMMAIIQNLKG